MQVLPVADGWTEVLDKFKMDHIGEMDRDAKRFIVLLIDFDGNQNRLDYAKEFIPAHLSDRVFILGVWTKPEQLKGKLEGIGPRWQRTAVREPLKRGTIRFLNTTSPRSPGCGNAFGRSCSESTSREAAE